MGTVEKILFILFINQIYSYTCQAELYERTVTWTKWKEFEDYGWVAKYGAPSYNKPSELDPRFSNLNNNSSGVWGWIWTEPGRGYYTYTLDLSKKPEHCGLLYAALEAKFYINGSTENYQSSIYPVNPDLCGGSRKCSKYLYNSNGISWQFGFYEIDLYYDKVITFNPMMYSGGSFLVDEMTLTYVVRQDSKNCPTSCNADCNFVAIDCHNYYSCVNRTEKEFFSCKAENGLAFNPKTESCDLIENVEGCDPAKIVPPPRCACEYRPHEENSTLYYFCRDTCQPESCVQKSCPSGLVWTKDPENGQQQCAPSGVLAF